MTDQNMDKTLDQMAENPAPKVDPEIKKSHLLQAQAEFSQAFAESARQSENKADKTVSVSHTLRRFMMNLIQNKVAYSTFGTLAVCVLAISVAINLTPPTQQNLPVVVSEPILAEETVQRTDSGKEQNSLATPTVPEDNQVAAVTSPPVQVLEDADVAEAPSAARSSQQNNESVAKSAAKISSERDRLAREQQQFANTGNSKPARQTAELEALGMPTSQLEEVVVTSRIVGRSAPAPAQADSPTQTPAARPDAAEEYAEYQPNPIVQVAEQPVSTFSIDVDTASYALVRSQLSLGLLPNPKAVRAEEMINYFDYAYPLPESRDTPFEPSVKVLDSPWNSGKKLLHIGIKGYDLVPEQQPDSNLVFLLDVSGSMNQANKLPLVKQSLGLLLDTLKPTDTVAIAVYAGAAGTILEPTPAKDKQKVLSALNRLTAGGSTAGGQGLRLAYALAEQHFSADSVNRIILATDGDFNVGQSSNQELKTLVERQRDKGIFLSVLGFGRHNYQDDMMQTLAQNGNGVAAYIDTLSEARKVLVEEASSTLFPIAKDVKIQLEFNAATVSDYRLVGYETRALQREDFNNDKVDAGDIGAGHSVTAIYEITPTNSDNPTVDPLRYGRQQSDAEEPSQKSNEYGFLKVRYKLPEESKSKLIELPIYTALSEYNTDTGFAVAVAGFAQLLSGSKHTGSLTYDDVIEQALRNRGEDRFGYRSEFIQLVRQAKVAQP